MSSIKRHTSTLPFPFSRAVQAQAVMDRIAETLQLAGAGFSDVVTVWLADMDNLEQFNAVYRRYFSDGFPARSAVQARLAFDVGVEVEMQALIGG